MAKGRKRVSLPKDALQALNSIGQANGSSGSSSASKTDPENKAWNKFNLIVGMFRDLRLGSREGQGGKRREIQGRNKQAIVNHVVRILAEGCPAARVLEDPHALATVRSERFGLSPVGENPDMAQIEQIRDIVLSALPEGVEPSDMCQIFGWPEKAAEEKTEASNSEPAEKTEEKPDPAPTVRRRNRKPANPVAAE